ncbi:hypothetical protein OAA37_00750 [bacterium]|jgi:hypothetical protein|nr:hypothetical protein [bacterium]MDB4347983.1 hypothetical protein [bacterium]
MPQFNLTDTERQQLKELIEDQVIAISDQKQSYFYWSKEPHPVAMKYKSLLEDLIGSEAKVIYIIQPAHSTLYPHIDKEDEDEHMRVTVFSFPITLPNESPTLWYDNKVDLNIVDETYYGDGDTYLLNTKHLHGVVNDTDNKRSFLQITFNEKYDTVLQKVA